jgi:UDP-GlcNAc:undecaprenyl-phosphate/decaprenyl-phosphate GlcNAc-1-phosphate transferase
MSNLVSPLIISILVSLVLGYPAMLLAKSLRIIDIPDSAPHKTHTHPTPLAGGILVAAALILMAFFFWQWLNHEVLVVLTGAFVVFIFGLWDDLRGLSAGPKLIGQFIAAVILISSGVQVYFATILSNAGYISPFIAQVLNIVITLFWLFGITNALNMIDSMDGIVAGLGIIASVCFIGATKVANQPVLTFWSAILLGISMGLYYWNNLAGKFFLGDSGAQTIGFLLASFGIMYNPLNRNPESSWIVPIMLLGVPIFDTSLVVLSRLRRSQPVGSGRRDHTYHRLIALGVSPRYAVMIVHLAALIISCLAFLTLYLPVWLALIFFFSTILCGAALLLWLERKPTLDNLSN